MGFMSDQVPAPERQKIMAQQKEEVERRIDELRGGDPLPEIEGRKVILVDNDIATGSTMRASIKACKNLGASKIVVAVPISSE